MRAPVLPTARTPALEVLRANIIFGRAWAQLSQEALAERAGISRPTISRIERGIGDVGIEVVQRIADALGVPVHELFISPSAGPVTDDELARRAADPASEYVHARAVLAAIDEAARPVERYSRAGRPPMAR